MNKNVVPALKKLQRALVRIVGGALKGVDAQSNPAAHEAVNSALEAADHAQREGARKKRGAKERRGSTSARVCKVFDLLGDTFDPSYTLSAPIKTLENAYEKYIKAEGKVDDFLEQQSALKIKHAAGDACPLGALNHHGRVLTSLLDEKEKLEEAEEAGRGDKSETSRVEAELAASIARFEEDLRSIRDFMRDSENGVSSKLQKAREEAGKQIDVLYNMVNDLRVEMDARFLRMERTVEHVEVDAGKKVDKVRADMLKMNSSQAAELEKLKAKVADIEGEVRANTIVTENNARRLDVTGSAIANTQNAHLQHLQVRAYGRCKLDSGFLQIKFTLSLVTELRESQARHRRRVSSDQERCAQDRPCCCLCDGPRRCAQ